MSEIPEYYELIDAIVGLACQFLEDYDGVLDAHSVSAGEIAIDTLDRLGLIVGDRIVPEAYDIEYLKSRFTGSVDCE